MAESNRNREPPPMCPCGFWGSPQILGLCSKCYKEKTERESVKAPIRATPAAAIAPSVTTTICTQVDAPDCRRGQSLVVHAINEGRQVARQVDLDLMGHTSLAGLGGVVQSSRTAEQILDELWSRPVTYETVV